MDMEYRVFGESIWIRLDVGDEVLDSIQSVCEKEKVGLATVSGIGAVRRAVLGLYQVSCKQYTENTIEGDFEMVSLLGDVTQMDGKPYLHLHASFGNAKSEMFGGHLKKAIISVTGEICIKKIAGNIGRKQDSETGLNVFNFNM